MVFRQTPKDPYNYIAISNQNACDRLGELGYLPLYMDYDYSYYTKTTELLELIERECMQIV